LSFDTPKDGCQHAWFLCSALAGDVNKCEGRVRV
jgi:hypothetical protein